MRVNIPLLSAVVLLRHVRGQEAATPPTCSVNCLATIVPQFCGSLTNTTCVCSNNEMTAAIEPCVAAACNVTDSLLLQRFSAESCGVPNDKSRIHEQIRIHSTVPVFATFFVAVRIFVRIKLGVGLGYDDWAVLGALLAYFTDTGAGISIVLQGFGQHTYWLDADRVSRALMFFYIGEMFYLLAITLTKLSLLLFFKRIFPNKTFIIAIWVMTGFVILSNFALLMALCFQCVPFHGNWTNWQYKVPPIKCINAYAVAYTAAGISIAQDVIILLMPIPILWNLSLVWRKKANLLVMFSIGIFVILCSLLRLPSLKKLNTSQDPSYDQAPIAVWTDLEVGVGIICSCLPAFRSLIGHMFPSLQMSLVGSTSGNARRDIWPSSSRIERRRNDPSTRTFIELETQLGSQEDIAPKQNEGASVTTEISALHNPHRQISSAGKMSKNRF